MRSSLVRIRSRLKCQVHALCADHGVPVEMTHLFGSAGRELLAGLVLPPLSDSRLAANLRIIDALGSEIAAAEREINRQQWRRRAAVKTEPVLGQRSPVWFFVSAPVAPGV